MGCCNVELEFAKSKVKLGILANDKSYFRTIFENKQLSNNKTFFVHILKTHKEKDPMTSDTLPAQPSAKEIHIHSSGKNTDADGPPLVRFVHYNDVYHVEPGSMEPVGGVARLKTLFDNYRRSDERPLEREGGKEKENGRLPELLTFFSGDAFNPSLESSVTKGEFLLVC